MRHTDDNRPRAGGVWLRLEMARSDDFGLGRRAHGEDDEGDPEKHKRVGEDGRHRVVVDEAATNGAATRR